MKLTAAAPRLLDGKYRIERLLGRGGMGSVYGARDLVLDRAVAIKVIRPELIRDPDARARFHEEARTLARLQHPSIVDVFDYGTLANGSPYLVMELVRGDDLRHELAREGRLEPERGGRILAAICAAMEAAHREGVLHCDLKPENILLADEGVEAKVLDFGVARAVSWQPSVRGNSVDGGALVTLDADILGTPAYMAPEQLRGDPPDARSDVFSLGVIAHEMLTGALPFGGGTIAEVTLAQARGLRAGELDGLPAPLSRAIRAALALDPDRRPPSPQAFAHLIGAAGGL
jgi:serine/threonine protein kinase